MVEEAGSPPIATSEPLSVVVVGLLVGVSGSGWHLLGSEPLLVSPAGLWDMASDMRIGMDMLTVEHIHTTYSVSRITMSEGRSASLGSGVALYHHFDVVSSTSKHLTPPTHHQHPLLVADC